MYLILVIKFKQQSLIFRPHHVGENCICSWYYMCICCQLLSAWDSLVLFDVSLCFVFTLCAPESIGTSLLFYERSWRCSVCFLWLCLWLVISTWKSQPTSWCGNTSAACVSVALYMYVCVLHTFHYIACVLVLPFFLWVVLIEKGMVERWRLRIKMNLMREDKGWSLV